MPATRLPQHHWPLALQALAAEVVSLEERCLHLRSSELRAAVEAEGAAEVRHRSEHRSQMAAQEVASLEATIQALRVGMPCPARLHNTGAVQLLQVPGGHQPWRPTAAARVAALNACASVRKWWARGMSLERGHQCLRLDKCTLTVAGKCTHW